MMSAPAMIGLFLSVVHFPPRLGSPVRRMPHRYTISALCRKKKCSIWP
jgi:hypothetical protein